MIEYDNRDFFCTLYVLPTTKISAEELAAWIAKIIGGINKGANAIDEFAFFDVKYDRFGSWEVAETDFTRWPFRIECFPITNEIDTNKSIYKEVIISAIKFLRKEHHSKVVAVCNFEEEIRDRTGWNWTSDTQLQPDNLE